MGKGTLHANGVVATILDRVPERGRFFDSMEPSGQTRHLKLENLLRSCAGPI
jgi:hypothetical protein